MKTVPQLSNLIFSITAQMTSVHVPFNCFLAERDFNLSRNKNCVSPLNFGSLNTPKYAISTFFLANQSQVSSKLPSGFYDYGINHQFQSIKVFPSKQWRCWLLWIASWWAENAKIAMVFVFPRFRFTCCHNYRLIFILSKIQSTLSYG